MNLTKEQMEAMQRLWIERSTQWEQGAEGPSATDRGSFKCGFFDGIRYAEAHGQKMRELKEQVRNLETGVNLYRAAYDERMDHLDIAEDALEFYANEGSWKLEYYENVARVIVASDCEAVPDYAEYTGGKHAREALAKIRGQG
jgi:hypothetical protein